MTRAFDRSLVLLVGRHRLRVAPGTFTWWLVLFDLFFTFEQAFVKVAAVERVYGLAQGLMTVPRTLWLNFINVCACVLALRNFVRSKRNGGALTWSKTAHHFPTGDKLGLNRKPPA